VEEDTVALRRGDLLALRRLLWDVGSTETTQHDQKVECFHWGAVLDHLAGMPPWSTAGQPTQAVIAFYEGVATHVQRTIALLRETEGH
jgi:hypothetical protein